MNHLERINTTFNNNKLSLIFIGKLRILAKAQDQK